MARAIYLSKVSAHVDVKILDVVSTPTKPPCGIHEMNVIPGGRECVYRVY